MHILRAFPLSLALSTLSSHAIPMPQNTFPVDAYVPLNTYETFESPPPEDSLRTLADGLRMSTANIYTLSVFYTYNVLPASKKAALTAERALNKTIDEEVDLCMWSWKMDCWPLYSHEHRRETQHGWEEIRMNGEKDYDQRMEYVGQGEEVAGDAEAVEG
jgi:hypothetical protein